ncbi:MAG: hypothetical protein CFH21_00003 [Alphaproteobacteria bacterium MarineAlpha5_Bin11]|nr:hypothetical protein [Pelagibacteraceae bacterium]PPR45142.1 MAG: hypothetical protein CFH21_00003 [Alphaproteobacteria bacterium MarineAlpha5_Bin11]PPR52114.1 MAG: hypothetical protein CFH20_00019 [Alphaproteobacteria bacterium MarineAlpha5_Bin10]
MKKTIKNLKSQNHKLCYKMIKDEESFSKFKNLNGWTLDSLKNSLKKKNTLAYGFFVEEKLVGFIISYFVILNKILDLDILLLIVQNKYRRLGIGKSLITHLVNQCETKYHLNIFIEFSKTNYIAKMFYTDYGFENVSYRKEYYTLTNGLREDAEIYKLTVR